MRSAIRVKIWKSDTGLFFPSGHYIDLSCSFVEDGEWGINMVGEIIPAASATKTINEVGSQFEKQQLSVPAGRVYKDVNHFTGSSFKHTVRVKDMVANETYYVDKESWDAQKPLCNECCICATPDPSIDPDYPTANGISVSWPAIPGAVVYEYAITQTSAPCAPPAEEDIVATLSTTATNTSLVEETSYCFALRAKCQGGGTSDWTYIQFTTLPD